MKNQYFGDFGDYQKFSLLKILRDQGGCKILVHWMKTKDDGSTDGKHIRYLQDCNTWDCYDPKVFRFLKKALDTGKREVKLFEKSTHARGMSFINEYIENAEKRLKLFGKICADKKSSLIFFDPDNGIEVKSTTKRNSHGYVLWSDLDASFGSGKSVLVYQHFARKNRETFINEKIAEIKKHFSASVFVIKVKHSVYFLITQKSHRAKIRKSLEKYAEAWESLVSVRNL